MISMKRALSSVTAVAAAALLMASCSSSSSSSSTTAAGSGTTKPMTSTTAASMTGLLPYCPTAALAMSQTGMKSIQSSGTETDYSKSGSEYTAVLEACKNALSGQGGWAVTSSGSGGAGQYGGGGLTATKNGRYAAVEAGSSGSTTYLNVCVWPSKPTNNNCGESQSENNNENNN